MREPTRDTTIAGNLFAWPRPRKSIADSRAKRLRAASECCLQEETSMTNTDRSKQQFSEAPQTTRQQASRSGEPPASRNPVPAQRGTYEPARYAGRGQTAGPFAMMRRLSDEMDRIF